MAWIESHQNLASHPKLLLLCALTQWDQDIAIAKLHRLWWWALDYAPDGDLRKYNDSQVAMGMCVDLPNAQRVVAALVEARWLDREPYFRVHDWWDYSGRFLQVKWKRSPEQWQKVRQLYERLQAPPQAPLQGGLQAPVQSPVQEPRHAPPQAPVHERLLQPYTNQPNQPNQTQPTTVPRVHGPSTVASTVPATPQKVRALEKQVETCRSVGEVMADGLIGASRASHSAIEAARKALSTAYGRPLINIWPNDQERTLADVASRGDFDLELQTILDYRAALAPDEIKFFPQSIGKLLDGWENTLERIRTVKHSQSKGLTQAEKQIAAIQRMAEKL